MRELFGFPKKDKYIPSQTKRYEISKDEFSARRIQALRDICHELEEKYKTPVSLSVIGSLIKGKILTPDTAQRADIDVYLDVDVKSAPKSGAYLFIDKLGRELKTALEIRKSELGFEEVPSYHIKERWLDSGSFKSALDWYLFGNPFRNKGNRINLASFFSFSIGPVVKKYRNQFLLELSEMEDQKKAESTWQTIRKVVEKIERKGKIPEQIEKQFPQNLTEALKFYGVQSERVAA